MAKALLLLHAPEEQVASLEAALVRGLKRAFDDPAQVTVQLMRQLQPDHFYNPDSPHARPPLLLELVTAAGLPLGRVQDSLTDVIGEAAPDASSLALVMQERKFVRGPAQPFYYHYLMMKKQGFSNADYNDYYSNYHCSMGFQMPAIAAYSQNYIDQAASVSLAQALGMGYREVTSISELKIPCMTTLLGDPRLQQLTEPAATDEARFVDRENSVSFTSEVVLRLGDFEAIEQPAFPQHFPRAAS